MFLPVICTSANRRIGQHEAYYKSKCTQTVQDPSTKVKATFLEEETIKIEESYKVCQWLYWLGNELIIHVLL